MSHRRRPHPGGCRAPGAAHSGRRLSAAIGGGGVGDVRGQVPQQANAAGVRLSGHRCGGDRAVRCGEAGYLRRAAGAVRRPRARCLEPGHRVRRHLTRRSCCEGPTPAINSSYGEKRGELPGRRGRPRRPGGPAGARLRPPRRHRDRPARTVRLWQDDLDPRDRRPAGPRHRGRLGPRPAGRGPEAARPDRVPHAGAQRVRRSDRDGEPPLLRRRARRRVVRRGARHRSGRPRLARRRPRRSALRRPTLARLAGCRAPGQPGARRAGRADGRPRSGPSPRPLGPLPPPGRRRRDASRLQPRHGRSLALRPVVADARRRHPRRRDAASPALLGRRRGHRAGVPHLDRPESWCAMTPRVTFAVVVRVLAQLRRDPRTVAMLIVLPTVLISLMWWMFIDSPGTFDRIGGPLLAGFPAIIMFVVTSVATLRERASGTLSRLFTMPMGKLDFLLGYALAFALIAVVQALVVVSIALYLLDLNIQGDAWQLGVVAVLDGVLGAALGLFASAFAATEFQAVQMMPAVMIPQILLCGLLIPRDQLPSALHAISDILPLSYAVDAVIGVAQGNGFTSGVGTDALIVLAFILAALTLGAATLKRRTA